MLTNTYKPLIGGLEKSIETFTKEYRKRGHKTLIITPKIKDAQDEEGILRVPAIKNFAGTDYSLQLPVPSSLSDEVTAFEPDIVHSHHPFLIGDTALRLAAKYRTPITYTFHTLYNKYTEYMADNSEALARFVTSLSIGYANLCDLVFAPSQSARDFLLEKGLKTETEIIPTGIYTEKYKQGKGDLFRRSLNIPKEAFVIGFVSRIAPEKNIMFLAKAVSEFMLKVKDAYFIIIGEGTAREDLKNKFKDKKVVFTGALDNEKLISAYSAMDIFVFASKTETQGLVITEAMASGVPVVALEAPGVKEVVRNKINGMLIKKENTKEFSEAIYSLFSLSPEEKSSMSDNCMNTAEKFSVENCVTKALSAYEALIRKGYRPLSDQKKNDWDKLIRLSKTQWELMKNIMKASGVATGIMPEHV